MRVPPRASSWHWLSRGKKGASRTTPTTAGRRPGTRPARYRASLRLPHDVGTDHGSVGVFQQQWPWWGSLTEPMTPATAARKFYRSPASSARLADPLTVAAQRVQRSAYPDAYADDADTARRSSSRSAAAASSRLRPTTLTARQRSRRRHRGTGGVARASPPRRQRPPQLGRPRQPLGCWHTGTDFSVACGTPVLAATRGTIEDRPTQSWAGPWLVKVSTGPGMLTTWYAHMQALTVQTATGVPPGSRSARSATWATPPAATSTSRSTRRAAASTPDNINPTTWLKQHVGRHLPGQSPSRAAPSCR